ncbi:hypothetical protein NQ166_01485 [Microbacterium sp. zg.Y1090]|uniref:hypothetical protein n=1 Tax=Microbacterium wangruii TaxID=3049073 RepID=UPI00214AA65C|nr:MULTISPECIES: hypothetical protein [unclassified Microbacterium]MCR2817498.1 hypothetical protein [Microbacterium sp. zg.Y1090]WIM29019.1 hypothetical protein QNO26_03725 [Microbacterium sp. zg-Y1090]
MNPEPITSGSVKRVPQRTRPLWLFPLTGATAALVGLLPWLLTGARMPTQNLWAFTPGVPPIILLPFSQYAVGLILSVIVVGAALAGIGGRALGARSRRRATGFLLAGVGLVQLGAVAQTAATVAATLQERTESAIYVTGLTLGSVLTIAIGLAATTLIATAPQAGALIGLAVGSAAAGGWLSAIIVPFGSFPPEFPAALWLVQWVPAVLVGAAITWTGVSTAGRVIAAIAAIVIVWVTPAVVTGLTNAVGSRVLAESPADMLDYGLGVFRMALFEPALAMRPILTAIVVAAIGLGLRALLRRPREIRA